jgi:hypothetical protein
MVSILKCLNLVLKLNDKKVKNIYLIRFEFSESINDSMKIHRIQLFCSKLFDSFCVMFFNWFLIARVPSLQVPSNQLSLIHEKYSIKKTDQVFGLSWSNRKISRNYARMATLKISPFMESGKKDWEKEVSSILFKFDGFSITGKI